DLLTKGLYLSRIDNNTRTYDLRLKLPNAGDYFTLDQSHTIEHLAATILRNSEFSDQIVYFGPMGCATGFYLVVFDIKFDDLLSLLIKTFEFISTYDGPIPGATRKECGNYKAHDLSGARLLAIDYVNVLKGWTEDRLIYRT
ncbi:MAG: S-ribosylhomocysteine lyase, partial [Clostridia bacterium]